MPIDFEIWGAEENFLTNYLNSRALCTIQLKESQEDLNALYTSDNPDDELANVLKIENDTAYIYIAGILNNDGPDWLDRRLGLKVAGYKQIISAADRIEADGRVKTVKMLLNTPGGRFMGVDNVWKRIMALRKGRQIIAVNEGVLASAGYYMASAAHKIYSTSETNEIGSIGIMVSGMDWSKFNKEKGIEKVVIVSKNAPKKDESFSTAEGRKILQARVDMAEQFFLDRISKGRELTTDYVAENFGRGDVFFSKNPVEGKPDALSVGMIDKIINISSETGGNDSPVSIKSEQEDKMDLTALLATDPEAKAEYERTLSAKGQAEFDRGREEGKKEMVAIAENVFTFMKDDSPYAKNPQVQATCIAVLKGEQPKSNLDMAVTTFDMMLEKHKSAGGKKEGEETPDTPGDHEGQPAADGKIKDEESLAASIENEKNFSFSGAVRKPKPNS